MTSVTPTEATESWHEDLEVDASPTRITAGGVVLIRVESYRISGDYTVEWTVTGPVVLPRDQLRIALLGATTVSGGHLSWPDDHHRKVLQATLDTAPLSVGSWRVGVRLTRIHDDSGGDGAARADGGGDPEVYYGESEPIEVAPRPFAAGDDVSVTLKRTAVPATSDQALWIAIRNSTNGLGFASYSDFLDLVMCGDTSGFGAYDAKDTRHLLHKVKRRTALPFPNVDRYRLLKAATEVFLMLHCGVDADGFTRLDLDLEAEGRRLQRPVQASGLEEQWRSYLARVATGDGQFLEVLPYLELIRLKLRDVPVVGVDQRDEDAEVCYGILAEKLANPCFLELLWSYWNEEGHLAQTINAITWRFQNRTTASRGRDPLAGLEIDPLRPLNNLLWGWIQDTQHRLTTMRRAYEYDHHYGLVLASSSGPPVRGADSRSRFVEAFHQLLRLCSQFYEYDDDTTRIADGFGVLNGLKETHLLLTQGAHNQYGDLPWTARHEMLMTQWILARPEMRDFLPTRTMVAYPEPWMDRVEAMNKLQGWSDTPVLHFRDLAVFGEQLLLGIRFGNWTTVIEPEQAANWARYWRAEVQGYVHGYRAVTGVDLTAQADRSMPALHLRRRYAYRG
jgi:hypothetical protein